MESKLIFIGGDNDLSEAHPHSVIMERYKQTVEMAQEFCELHGRELFGGVITTWDSEPTPESNAEFAKRCKDSMDYAIKQAKKGMKRDGK